MQRMPRRAVVMVVATFIFLNGLAIEGAAAIINCGARSSSSTAAPSEPGNVRHGAAATPVTSKTKTGIGTLDGAAAAFGLSAGLTIVCQTVTPTIR